MASVATMTGTSNCGCGTASPSGGLGVGGCGCIGAFATFNHLPSAGSDDCQTGAPGCLAAESVITLSNGSQKRADEVCEGDKIIGRAPTGEPREQLISDILHFDQNLVRVKFGFSEILCSDSHPFFLEDGRIMLAPCLDPGDKIVAENGETVEVISVTRIGTGPVVGWKCSPDENFFYNGVLNHNKTRVVDAPYF